MKKVWSYLKASREELVNKVTWPTWQQLQSSATIVLIATIIIAVSISGMDWIFGKLVTGYYRLF